MKVSNETYTIIVSNRATQMLVSHAAFLAKVSESAAEHLVVSFEEAASSLEKMPQRCPWLTGEFVLRNAYRYLLFDKRYLILYQVKDDTVYIEYIVDCRQDYSWLLR